MTETIGTLDARLPPATPLPGELALRIRGGDYHGRIVRIRANQCTIGSAPDCTLRLAGPGLRPLHCIILRGEAGATVRRWSPDTQLNGRAFSDALLMVGDRLEVGPIELEVLDDTAISASQRPDSGSPNNQVPVADLAVEIVSHLRRDLQREKDVRRHKAARKRLVQQRRRIKALEGELQRWQAVSPNAPTPELSAAMLEQADSARIELQAERTAWNVERQSLLQKLQDDVEAAVNEEVLALRRQIAALQSQAAHAISNGDASELQTQLTLMQQQLHEVFAESERLREELHLSTCALATAQCRSTEQEAALIAFRELHQHAIAELELERTSLQSQLAELQTTSTAQALRLEELANRSADADAASETGQRLAVLEAQLQQRVDDLAVVHAEKLELQFAAQQSSAEWSQREQELAQRVECLERLASNLEDELRKATVNPDKIEQAEEQRQMLEQQLSTATRQWSEQRQVLEEQALSAHEQLQDMENQNASMRDALQIAHNQVRERDQLLTQLRDEVRGQLAIWQNEREQLLQQLAGAGQASNGSIAEAATHQDVANDGRDGLIGDDTRNDSRATYDLQASDSAQDDVQRSNGTDESRLGESEAEPISDQQRGGESDSVWPARTEGSAAEESIEAYMARLLKRVRGDTVADAVVWQDPSAESVQEAPAESAVVEETKAVPALLNTEEFLPRKSAPEQAADLAAMRELAVHSTRQAIKSSGEQRFKTSSLGTTLGACGFIGLSVGLFGWGFDTGNWLAWTGSGVCLLAGMALIMRRLQMRTHRRPA